MIARNASCWAWLRSPHCSPARWNATGGKLDQRCFCAVSVQSNDTVSFCVSSSVARNAFAAAVTFWVVALPVADAEADVDGTVLVAVEPEVPDEQAVATSRTVAAPAIRAVRRGMVIRAAPRRSRCRVPGKWSGCG